MRKRETYLCAGLLACRYQSLLVQNFPVFAAPRGCLRVTHFL